MTAASVAVGQNTGVSATFPMARKGKPGYDVDEVETFLADARRAYATLDGGGLTSDDIRHTAFRVVRREGYSVRHVDAALERLEEAFAARERDRAIAERGEEAFYRETREIAQEIVDRLARPEGRRFRRASALARGYHPADVDAFTARVSRYFQDGDPLTVDAVRTIAFRSRFGGYDETQVDVVLDAVIRVMLAVR
ncbi:DivIVA domain-containing protein [Microcella alkalica]|uniref:DivIVA domain-containing protein n=1 Tax=Microcella alkalica TaxID=355930 RepID=UPI00145ED2A9|nr:DivIVA domain-containing protein [Microcella alkalica]